MINGLSLIGDINLVQKIVTKMMLIDDNSLVMIIIKRGYQMGTASFLYPQGISKIVFYCRKNNVEFKVRIL